MIKLRNFPGTAQEEFLPTLQVVYQIKVNSVTSHLHPIVRSLSALQQSCVKSLFPRKLKTPHRSDLNETGIKGSCNNVQYHLDIGTLLNTIGLGLVLKIIFFFTNAQTS